MKKIIVITLLIAIAIFSSACAGKTDAAAATPITASYDAEDLAVSVDGSLSATIRLDGDSISVDGGGVLVSGSVATITNAGVYNIQGILNDGQIVVDTEDEESVTLILNGAIITNLTGAPIYVANAEKVVINLAEGTQSVVSDGTEYAYLDESGEPNAAVFSKDDLTINGSGTLTVNANYNNGIASKDDLIITSGTIIVNAVNDGIKGKDSVSIAGGNITIASGADGIQSTNADEAEKGYILIEGGVINITSGLDAIQAETRLQINGGEFNITSGGGAVSIDPTGIGGFGGRGMEGNPYESTESAKGLKAGVDITILDGTFNINSADDSIHTNVSITISGGNFQLKSSDDGIHADSTLTISGGDIHILQSYEGIESAIITINDGNIHVMASDDGVNASGGGGTGGGWGGGASGDYRLYINGGTLFVDAYGDGLDVNGPIEMTNGFVIVNGPTNSGNGALDYSGSFNITGGYLLAAGSSGMAMAPSGTSTQYSVMYNFGSVQAAGTLVHIQTQGGEEIMTFAPTKEFQSIVISSALLQNGETYNIFVGGSSTGAVVDGLYSDGVYTPGTLAGSFTITGMVTSNGGGGFGPGGGAPGGGKPGGGQPPTKP